MTYQKFFVCLLLAMFFSPASYADVAITFEYAQVQDREIGDFDFDTGDSWEASLSFDLEDSLLRIAHSEEESTFQPLSLAYQREESSIAWHWNETITKDKFFGFAFGFFSLDYDVFNAFDENFLGLMIGAKRTNYLFRSEHLFFIGEVWFKLPYSSSASSSNEPDADEAKLLFGFEGKVALGFVVGRDSNFAVYAGARYRDISFSDRFVIDDTRSDLFVAMRILFPSGD